MLGQRNVYLIGPMGSGKTAVGRRLAALLGKEFRDSDAEIEKRTGVDIRYIFEKEGEARFRERERDVIADLTAQDDVVVATGGGVILDAANRERLAATGVVVYLETTIDTLVRRTKASKTRPLLMGDDPRTVLERLMVVRRPLYESTADLRIDTTGRQVRAVAAEVFERLRPRVAMSERTSQPPRVDTISVALAERSYPIHIGPKLLGQPELYGTTAKQVLIVTNDVVAPLYLKRVQAALGGRELDTLIVPDGERYKTLATFSTVIDRLIEGRFHRDCCLVALGGGVIGDLTGYAAASYQRGVDFVQVPTTLLAQVDSSVGGKTAVNHPRAKNMIGAFHQPIAVLADTDTLRSLPPRELGAGLAEIVKYGIIVDAEFFEWLETHVDELRALDAAALTHAIRRSCEIKAAIVAEDEREHGRRALLNLGHTFGHALEAIGNYERWLHGEAVAIGIVLAARTSAALGWLRAADCARIERLLARAGLPTAAPGVDVDALLEAMRGDKKADRAGLKLILIRALGDARVTRAPAEDTLRAVLAEQLK